MRIETLNDDGAVAARTAEVIAQATLEAQRRSGRAVLAFSGGSTPAAMLRRLAGMHLNWDTTHIVQVDERVAPDGHPDRNWTMITDNLVKPTGLSESLLHPMPVTDSDLDAAAERYATLLTELCGVPPAVDVVHLGIGPDGHTASLVPGDPALEIEDRWVAMAGPYQGRQRMTFTYPTINAGGLLVWQVTGADKASALRDGLEGTGVPASNVRRTAVWVIATDEAAAHLS